jgi:hypothetical protein
MPGEISFSSPGINRWLMLSKQIVFLIQVKMMRLRNGGLPCKYGQVNTVLQCLARQSHQANRFSTCENETIIPIRALKSYQSFDNSSHRGTGPAVTAVK